jgi:hypothetical protein
MHHLATAIAKETIEFQENILIPKWTASVEECVRSEGVGTAHNVQAFVLALIQLDGTNCECGILVVSRRVSVYGENYTLYFLNLKICAFF